MEEKGLYGYRFHGVDKLRIIYKKASPSGLGKAFLKQLRKMSLKTMKTTFKKKRWCIFDNEFIKDSGNCSYAYICNLSRKKFEIWWGFQKTPDRKNRYGMQTTLLGWYPCKLIKEYDLTSLPDEETFLKDMQTLIGFFSY